MWSPPALSNGVITGYQLRFTDSFSRTTTVNKLASESYHVVVSDNVRILDNNIQVLVRGIVVPVCMLYDIYLPVDIIIGLLLQVKARTSAGYGSYSAAIPYTGECKDVCLGIYVASYNLFGAYPEG